MKITLEQTRFVGLNLELECKVREYQFLCEEYEKARVTASGNEANLLTQKIKRTQKEIEQIKQQINFLKYS